MMASILSVACVNILNSDMWPCAKVDEGKNNGRVYKLRVAVSPGKTQKADKGTPRSAKSGEEIRDQWVDVLDRTVKEAKQRYEDQHRLSVFGKVCQANKTLHDDDRFQQFFGAVIMASFLISMVQTEMTPAEGTFNDFVFYILDLIFTGLFTVEWIVTFLGHCGLVFLHDSWRIFDSIIVAISLISATGIEMPAIKSIRALRVLRAVRLLKKSKSLKPIVEALFASILPVLNSMVLLGLITAIYASVAVGLFAESQPIMFGKFSRAMFTMFQVCTGDGWATDITREMFPESGIVQPLPVLFFVSYMLIAAIVLINIIIAVLLDEFLTTMAKSRAEFDREEILGANPELDNHVLDPVMEILSKYRSLPDLEHSIHLIYSRIDVDGSGGIGYSELRDGLPNIIELKADLNLEDWYHLTEDVLKKRQVAKMMEEALADGDIDADEQAALDAKIAESLSIENMQEDDRVLMEELELTEDEWKVLSLSLLLCVPAYAKKPACS